MNAPEHPERQHTYQIFADDKSDPKRITKSEALLSKVLGETLSRQSDDPSQLIEILARWRRTLAETSFGEPLCHQIVARVIDHRLGCNAAEVPEELRREVADALWNDPESRSRIDRLWNSVAEAVDNAQA